MIRISVNQAVAAVTETETLTAGRVGLKCGFTFTDSAWSGLSKVAVFEGAETLEVVLGNAAEAVVPPECMETAGYALRVGVYGMSADNGIVIPTVWAKVGKIRDSAAPDDGSFAPATPDVVAQIIQTSNDAIDIARRIEAEAAAGDFDGVSPEATVTKSGKVATISITDRSGTTSASVSDGASAYEQAVEGGYVGSEEDFNTDLAAFKDLATQAAYNAGVASDKAADASTDAGTATTKAAAAAADALKAEGHAVGKQNGTDVDSGSTYYHNNAAYYAGQASTDAGTAATKAGEASGSASSASTNALKAEGYAVGKQNGEDVGSGSTYYHANAAYYAGEASGSATSAGTDALAAEGFAVGEQGGVEVESGSPYYENNAKYYCETAESVAASIPEDYSALSDTVEAAVGYTLRGLPEGYTELWAVESDGASLIDTGIGWYDYHVRAVIEVQSSGGSFFGNYYKAAQRFYGGLANNWFYGSKVLDLSDLPDYTGGPVLVDYSDTFLKFNGTTITTFDATEATGSNQTIRLLGYGGAQKSFSNAGTRIFSAKLYKVIDNVETLVFDGVPCVRDLDGAVGFYDLVGEDFHGAAEGTPAAVTFPDLVGIEERTGTLEATAETLEAADADLLFRIETAADVDFLAFEPGIFNTPAVGSTGSITREATTTGRVSAISAVTPGQTFKAKYGAGTSGVRGYAILDEDLTVLKRATTSAGEKTVVVPEGGAWLVVNTLPGTANYYAAVFGAEPEPVVDSLNVGVFNRIGVCGYSWDSGYAYSNYTGTTHVYTRRSRSWGAVLANLYGIDFSCYGVPSGTTCAPESSWIGTDGAVCWQTNEHGLPKLLDDDPCDLYWFHLFGNDWKKLGSDYLGTIDDIKEDYTQNPDTFYGNYGRIMAQILEHAPYAKFIFSYKVLESSGTTQTAFAEAVLALAEHYGVPVINWYDDPWYMNWTGSDHQVSNHPTFVDYAGMAKAADRLFAGCAKANWDYFKNFVPAADA